MVVVLAILREADAGKSLLVEGAVISTTQVAIQPEDERGLELRREFAGCLRDVPCYLPRRRIAFKFAPDA